MKPAGVGGSGEINCIWNVSVQTLNHERSRDVLNPCRCFINPVSEASIKVAPRPKNESSCLIPEPPSAILPARGGELHVEKYRRSKGRREFIR